LSMLDLDPFFAQGIAAVGNTIGIVGHGEIVRVDQSGGLTRTPVSGREVSIAAGRGGFGVMTTGDGAQVRFVDGGGGIYAPEPIGCSQSRAAIAGVGDSFLIGLLDRESRMVFYNEARRGLRIYRVRLF